jgi:hypothetical protein
VRSWLAAAALVAVLSGPRPETPRLLVAADDGPDGGAFGVVDPAPPFPVVAGFRAAEPGSVLRASGKQAFLLSRRTGVLAVHDLRSGKRKKRFALGAETAPQDLVVLGPRLAYVSRERATHLLRIDPRSGRRREVVDLSAFADADGRPDLGNLLVHDGRLFVQIRRFDDDAGGFAPPALIAVVDLATETLVDADPARDGVQAIELEGTSPKMAMQVIGDPPKLFVSATGGFFDAGGLERIDLDTLASEGLVIAEADGRVGADLGAFVMTSPSEGFLVFSTDLLLSSHLLPFTLAAGPAPGPEWIVSLDYFAPALAYEAEAQRLYYPHNGTGDTGVHVFDAVTGERLTESAAPAPGPPSDLRLLP